MDNFEKIADVILAVVAGAAELLAYGTAVRLKRRPVQVNSA